MVKHVLKMLPDRRTGHGVLMPGKYLLAIIIISRNHGDELHVEDAHRAEDRKGLHVSLVTDLTQQLVSCIFLDIKVK